MGGIAGLYGPPVPLEASHDISGFDCGKAPLTDWLRLHALKNEGKGSRTFVMRIQRRVVAYYALAAGAVERAHAPAGIGRNMPDPVPVIVLGRLAVDRSYHGKRLGSALLQDAIRRSLNASREIGARAIIVHAIDDEAAAFYLQYGFMPFPTDARTLYLALTRIGAAL